MAGRKKKAKSGGKRVGMVARKAKPRAARKTRGRTVVPTLLFSFYLFYFFSHCSSSYFLFLFFCFLL